MVNQVLLTYNPDRVLEGVIAAGDRANYILAASVQELVDVDRIFRTSLEDEGIVIEEANHSEGLEAIVSQIASAEFIWHNFNLLYRQLGTEFGVNRDAPIPKIQAICETIRNNGKLSQSHGIRDFLDSMDKVRVIGFLAERGIPVPRTQSVDEYLAGQRPVPIVLKFNEGTQGFNIFLVERVEQLVKYFDREFYREGIRRSIQEPLHLHESTLPNKKEYHLSEFIDGPSDHYTHFRILTFRDQILSAVLNYSPHKKSDETRMNDEYGRGIPGRRAHWTTAPKSPMYLRWKSIVSNHAAGATQIPVTVTSNSRKITPYEQRILMDHGINQTRPELPYRLESLAKRVGILFSEQGTAYLGQDWIMDKEGNFYCLEVNDAPGMDAFNVTHNHGKTNEVEGMRTCYRVLAKVIKTFDPFR